MVFKINLLISLQGNISDIYIMRYFWVIFEQLKMILWPPKIEIKVWNLNMILRPENGVFGQNNLHNWVEDQK